MSMNMQWGLISSLVLPWRMALSPAWCCLNMNFIRTHLSWLVMGFSTVLSLARTPFPIIALENLSLLLLFPFVLISGTLKQVFKYSNILMRDLWLQSWRTKTWLFSHLWCSCGVEKKVRLHFGRNFPMCEVFENNNNTPQRTQTFLNATVSHNRLLKFKMN